MDAGLASLAADPCRVLQTLIMARATFGLLALFVVLSCAGLALAAEEKEVTALQVGVLVSTQSARGDGGGDDAGKLIYLDR